MRACLLVQVPRAGVPDIEIDSLASYEDFYPHHILPVCKSSRLRVWFLTLSLLLLPVSGWLLLYVIICGGSVASLQVVFRVSCVICSCCLAVSVGRGKFRIFLPLEIP